jgi:hypothetical protein
MPGMSGTGAMSVTFGAVPARVRPWPGSGGSCPHRLDGPGRAARLGSCGIPTAGNVELNIFRSYVEPGIMWSRAMSPSGRGVCESGGAGGDPKTATARRNPEHLLPCRRHLSPGRTRFRHRHRRRGGRPSTPHDTRRLPARPQARCSRPGRSRRAGGLLSERVVTLMHIPRSLWTLEFPRSRE